MTTRAHRDGGATPARPRARLLPLLLAAALVAACQSGPPPAPDAPPAPRARLENFEAKFIGANGAAPGGSAVFHETRSGLDLALWLGSLPPGEYRVAIHERGNCSSPNAFSAGPPWAPPGVPLTVVLIRKGDDTRADVVHFPGYRLQGPNSVEGRSIVLHDGGSGSLLAEPGVRNNRLACGVIGEPYEMFPALNL